MEDFGEEESPPLAQRTQRGEEIRQLWGRDESGRSRRGRAEVERGMQRESFMGFRKRR